MWREPGPPRSPPPTLATAPAGVPGEEAVVQPVSSASGTMTDAVSSVREPIATRRISIPGPVLACAQARRYLGSPSSAPRYGRSAYASRFADTPQVGRIAFLRRCRRFIRATPESACLDRCRCLRGRPARESAPGARTMGRMASASPGAQPAAPLDAARLRAALLGDAADADRP